MSTGLRFTLEVDGLPPDAFAVVSFHLNQSLSSLFPSIFSLVSQPFLSLEFAQVLDKMAYLTIWQGDECSTVKGVVTWFELGENDKNQMLYSIKRCHRRCGVPVCARTSVSSRTRTSKASSARCTRKTG
ncbi:type VI secretion system Vgr family protein [Escherichia coli]